MLSANWGKVVAALAGAVAAGAAKTILDAYSRWKEDRA